MHRMLLLVSLTAVHIGIPQLQFYNGSIAISFQLIYMHHIIIYSVWRYTLSSLSQTVFHLTSNLRRQLTFSKLVLKHFSSLALFLNYSRYLWSAFAVSLAFRTLFYIHYYYYNYYYGIPLTADSFTRPGPRYDYGLSFCKPRMRTKMGQQVMLDRLYWTVYQAVLSQYKTLLVSKIT